MKPLDWCRERLQVAGQPLAASLPFAPSDHRQTIIALRALATEIMAVPREVDEAEVARRKLEWWSQALEAGSAHPAIEAWYRTSASAMLRGEFASLLAAVVTDIDPPRCNDLDEAWQYCGRLGGMVAVLEARALGADPALAECLRACGTFSELVRRVRDVAIDAGRHRWLVPLQLQAQYQVSRVDVVSGAVGRGWDGLVRHWLGDGLRRVEAAAPGADPVAAWRHRHVLIAHALDRRLASRLAARPGRILGHRFLPGHAGNVWTAWRCARRLQQAAR